jgi:hypothetical protein
MYVHFRSLGWLAKRGLFHAPFTFRRAAYACGFGLGQTLLAAIVGAARSLDPLMFPALATTPTPAPLFVIATPRSGTTYLHHLLELDEARFMSPRLYQTLAPSLLLDRACESVRGLDGFLGNLLERLADLIDRNLFNDWDGIHSVGLRAAEEDENLFVQSLTSPALYLLFPFVRQLPEFADITRLGQRVVRRVARDYRETGRRWAHTAGAARTLLIKNVLLASRLPVVDRAFPDARFIHVVRDPREAIPSALSLFYAMWRTHTPRIAPGSPEVRALADMFLEHYRLLCEQQRQRAKERWIGVRYEALTLDPVGSIERIYAALGFDVTPEYRARLERAAAKARGFKSRHRYDLAEFGLRESDLRAALGEHWDAAISAHESVKHETEADAVSV